MSQMDKVVMANHLDIEVEDKQRKTAVVVYVVIATSEKKDNEKLEKYQRLREELKEMWTVKATVIPVVIGEENLYTHTHT